MFELNGFLDIQSRGFAMSVSCIPDVEHLIYLRIFFSSHTMHFLLSHATRHLSSYGFPTKMRTVPVFEVHTWYDLFLFDIYGRFVNEPVFSGIIVLPLVRCIGGELLVGIMLNRGVLLFP